VIIVLNQTQPATIKTVMHEQNLMTQTNNFVNHLTIKNLPVELIELSENELKNIVGGHDKPKPKPKPKPKSTTTTSFEVNFKFTKTTTIGYHEEEDSESEALEYV
jgi:bacteriocin-like protein